MVRKKSAGVGRLNFQRRAYSFRAKSNSFAAENRFAQDVERGRGLAVGVGSHLHQAVGPPWVMIGTWLAESM